MKTVKLTYAIFSIIKKMPGFDKLPDIDKELIIQDLVGVALEYHKQKLVEITPSIQEALKKRDLNSENEDYQRGFAFCYNWIISRLNKEKKQ